MKTARRSDHNWIVARFLSKSELRVTMKTMKQFVKFKFTFCLNLPFPTALAQPFFQLFVGSVSPTAMPSTLAER